METNLIKRAILPDVAYVRAQILPLLAAYMGLWAREFQQSPRCDRAWSADVFGYRRNIGECSAIKLALDDAAVSNHDVVIINLSTA